MGVNPEKDLKTVKKVDLELKPHSKPIASIE
jgi:hypothetical protein